MTIGPTGEGSPAPSETINRLRTVRRGLLLLHKGLLDAERVRYERLNGRVEGGGTMLQLLLHDPWFAWLRPLSELIVQIDEQLDDDKPASANQVAALISQVKTLLRPREGSDDPFEENYFAALQQSPDVVMAHRAVMIQLKQSGAEPAS
ncbi:MAG: hypothetical protein MNPFHGCM_00836 [Gemmatimonadaceae bacterium]|nr:hypothetical protein [Gemmatimonadaceae bacterium]